MRNKRIFIILMVVGLLAAVTTTVYASSSAYSSTPPLVGTWRVFIPESEVLPEGLELLATFFADGNYIETSNEGSANTMAQGVWVGAGNTYFCTFQVFNFDEEGKYSGKRMIYVSIKMDGTDHYNAQFTNDIIDLEGNVIPNVFSGSAEATRMEVDLPTPQ